MRTAVVFVQDKALSLNYAPNVDNDQHEGNGRAKTDRSDLRDARRRWSRSESSETNRSKDLMKFDNQTGVFVVTPLGGSDAKTRLKALLRYYRLWSSNFISSGIVILSYQPARRA